MQKEILYKVTNPDGVITISTEKPENESYTETYRLLADNDKVLVGNNDFHYCVETDKPDEYTEIDEHKYIEMEVELLNK